MKCNEFMKAAECWTPSQLSLMRSDDPAMLAHARECAACGRWVESQCRLANAMQALRASTAQREASAKVEQAVLWAFRSQEFAPASPAAPERAAPVVWKLSRVFEIGAYAAVAAALIMAVFLGSRLLRDRQPTPKPTQVQAASIPQQSGSVTAANGASSSTPSEAASPERAARPPRAKTDNVTVQESRRMTGQTAMTAPDNEGYMALMLCDPLICSGDEQVIRMELPVASGSAGGSATQPVLADVVIGDDGLVRAMRIVN